MNLLYNFIIAFAMYSKIPMPRIDWTEERMRYTMCFFPLIGAVIGAVMLLWARFGMAVTGNASLYAAIMVLIPIVITGGIHLDGLLDTADALSSYKTMEEKLEILKDSHAGAFAIIVGCAYFILNYGVCHAMDFERMKVLAVGFVLSRALSGFAVVTFQNARKKGLAATFAEAAQKRTVQIAMIGYMILCLVIMIMMDPVIGVLCYVTAVLVFIWYRFMSYKKFGGITGDLAGFFLQVAELAMALVVVISSNLLH